MVVRADTQNQFKDSTAQRRAGSGVRLGLAESRDAVAILPLTTLLEDFHALEALHDVALASKSGRGA